MEYMHHILARNDEKKDAVFGAVSTQRPLFSIIELIGHIALTRRAAFHAVLPGPYYTVQYCHRGCTTCTQT